jgi:hypothetical protein
LRIGCYGDYVSLRGTRSQGSGENYIMRNLMICTHTKYYSADQIGKNVMGGARNPYGVEGIAYRVLVWIPDGKRPLGGNRHRWENDIKMNLQEVGWGHGLD